MNTWTIIACIFSAIFGGAVTWAWLKYVWPNRHASYTWIFRLRQHANAGQVCKTDLELHRDGYSLGYSFPHKCAMWASFIISEGSVGVDVERGERFYADTDVPEQYRTTPGDFKDTGYDRGHLAPSAAIDFSRKSNDQTFAMSNIALQDPELNRHAWGRLEGMIRDWTKTRGKLAVVVGPTFTDSPKKINGISVPKAFYVAAYSYQHKQSVGFFFLNKDTPASKIWDNACSIKELEEKTGYKFFEKIGYFHRISPENKAKVDINFWKKEPEKPKEDKTKKDEKSK